MGALFLQALQAYFSAVRLRGCKVLEFCMCLILPAEEGVSYVIAMYVTGGGLGHDQMCLIRSTVIRGPSHCPGSCAYTISLWSLPMENISPAVEQCKTPTELLRDLETDP